MEALDNYIDYKIKARELKVEDRKLDPNGPGSQDRAREIEKADEKIEFYRRQVETIMKSFE